MSTSRSSPSSRSSSGVNFTERRAAAAEDVHVGDGRRLEPRVRRSPGSRWAAGRRRAWRACATTSSATLPLPMTATSLRLERPRAREVGVPVVPAHEVGGAVASPSRSMPGMFSDGIAHGAGGEDHGVVVLLQVVERDVLAEAHVAEDADVAAVEHLAQGRDDALDARVVGRDAVAHEPVGCGEVLEQVDRDVEVPLGLEQDVGGVDAGGAGADDGESQLVRHVPGSSVGHRSGLRQLVVRRSSRRIA